MTRRTVTFFIAVLLCNQARASLLVRADAGTHLVDAVLLSELVADEPLVTTRAVSDQESRILVDYDHDTVCPVEPPIGLASTPTSITSILCLTDNADGDSYAWTSDDLIIWHVSDFQLATGSPHPSDLLRPPQPV